MILYAPTIVAHPLSASRPSFILQVFDGLIEWCYSLITRLLAAPAKITPLALHFRTNIPAFLGRWEDRSAARSTISKMRRFERTPLEVELLLLATNLLA
jgi:hypothetical protein